MLPSQLKPEDFASYAPQARRVAADRLALLRQIPLALLPLLLREIIAYDWKFPMERKELDRQLAYLGSLSSDRLQTWTAPFATLHLPPDLDTVDWVNAPAQFSEQLTAHLWATQQIDAFRFAAVEYVSRLNQANPVDPPPVPRLTIVVIGQGVSHNSQSLFRKLRPHGVYFKQVKADDGNRILLDAVASRAVAHSLPFGHWYVDGGNAEPVAGAGVTCLSYASLEPVRASILTTMENAMRSGAGPEALRTKLAQMRPQDLGIRSSGDQAVLHHFQIGLLTEGSGTQIFSTTFVQWSAREVLRRAQPITLMARFAPRRHEQSLRELLAGHPVDADKPLLDAEGALIDADMAAYYTWINQQRLPGADQSSFLAWFEGHNEAVAIAPALSRGAVSSDPLDMKQLLNKLG